MTLQAPDLVPGNRYRWKHQPERLIYLQEEKGWHQFALTTMPSIVWCELLATDLHFLEPINE